MTTSSSEVPASKPQLNLFAPLNPSDFRVTCFGQEFSNDKARREHFLEVLRLRLHSLHETSGFPVGTEEAILRLSDPPFYTACPNPFLEQFIRSTDGEKPATEEYNREPFTMDTSVGKSDSLYKAHGYHTKVPHLAIIPAILHYTEPGDIVLDAFCGSGMTGLAAQLCGTATADYRAKIEAEWAAQGRSKPKWGARRAVLSDLSPAATFIAAGYNIPFDVSAFAEAGAKLLAQLASDVGWMYQTVHTDGSPARINFTVWSEVFSCPECAAEVNFVENALDLKTKHVRDEFPCPGCHMTLTKKRLQRLYVSRLDLTIGNVVQCPKRVPVLINYSAGGSTFEKVPDERDLATIHKIEELALPVEIPSSILPYMHMTHERARLDQIGITHVHHFFLPRAAQSLAALWRQTQKEMDGRLRNALLFFAEQAIWGMSVLARYAPTHYSQVNQYLNGVYYIGSQIVDVSPWYILEGKLDRLVRSFEQIPSVPGSAIVSTGDCASLPLPNSCVDYVFTDPPFGENIFYADLNYLVESWHGVLTNAGPEAIIDPPKKKGVHEYQDLMRRCFEEYYRVLKAGRWMTIVFSNSSNAIWRAIQEAIGTAGFVIADVRTLDKQQGSFRQVTSSAVKQDLVISAYKPNVALTECFQLGTSSAQGAWAFVTEHLRHVPVFVGRGDQGADIIIERTAQMLLDRMTAFHVQRHLAVPLSGPEFLGGILQRLPERDGMYFLPEQVAQYDRKRLAVAELRQLDLFVTDESSAIQWLRRELGKKPQTFQELQPQFMREIQSWSKHEKTLELRELLEQNFLCFDSKGPVPSQIHAYLSSNFKELRNLDKADPSLVNKADGRWFPPDPAKQADIDRLREKTLLREFADYKDAKQRKLKLFRTEAVRAGFMKAYEAADYRTIVEVSAKLPESVLQEDEKLLMYYDVASMRLGEG